MLEKKDFEIIAEIISEATTPIYDRLDQVNSRLDQVDSRLDQVDSRLDQVDSQIGELREKVTIIQMTLENETNKNINIIAEGHLDLSRKLDDALKIENEKEMLLLRVNYLENEVHRIKGNKLKKSRKATV